MTAGWLLSPTRWSSSYQSGKQAGWSGTCRRGGRRVRGAVVVVGRSSAVARRQ